MKTFYTQKTVHGTSRIYVDSESLTPELIDNLNQLSVWGNYDISNENYKSWEIKKEDEGFLQFAFILFGFFHDYSFIK